ncbi:MAG: nitroreductase family protein [Bacteroidia bacterium]
MMTPPGKIEFPRFDINMVNRLIQDRRSLFPRDFSGEEVDRKDVEQILENANWAPTHGRTEPGSSSS